MARPTLSSHPKFAKLSARLKGRALARGVLELIWETCYASGEPVVGDAEALEVIADWRGEPGELAAALKQAGFVDVQTDANGGHVYRVHDLEDHAPDYVLKRWQREAQRKEKGLTLREIRQEAARKAWAERDAHVRRLQANVAPPAPAPAPALDPPVPPAPARSTPEAKIWSAWDWRAKFGEAWCAKYGRITYGAAGDAKACGELDLVLEPIPDRERREAQARAPQMFAEFLGSTEPRTVQRRHPFVFFVQEWGGLRVPAKRGAADERCAFHRAHGTRGKLPRDGGHDSCPECRHARAASGTRQSDPGLLTDALAAATERKVAELRAAGEKTWTPEQLEEMRQTLQRERHPPKAAAG